MKRSTILSLIASSVAFAGVSAANAIGICVEVDTWCNDYYFNLGAASADTLTLDGYEYGCGSNTRTATGVMRRVGTDWQLGFNGNNGGNFDYGQVVAWSGTASADTLAGSYEVMYTQIDAGVLTANGESGGVSISICSGPPVVAESAGPDASVGE